MKVYFKNVGRRKMTWTAEVNSLSDDSLIRAIQDKRALHSEGIEFDWNIQGIITSRKLPRGPSWIVPAKPAEPPEIPDAGMSRVTPVHEQDERKVKQNELP